MQLLEGPEASVLALLSIIRADPRHEKLVILDEWRMRERIFPEWKMGFQRLARDHEELPLGFDPFLESPGKPGHLASAHPATKFLLKFKGAVPTL